MDSSSIVGGLIEFVLVLVLAATTVRGSLWALDKATPDVDEAAELRKGNVALAITYGASLLSSALIVRRILEPSIFAFKGLVAAYGAKGALQGLGWLAGAAVLALLLATVGLLVANRIVAKAWNQLDVAAEVGKGNVAVAVVAGVVTVALGLFLADGAAALADGFAPSLPFVRVHAVGR